MKKCFFDIFKLLLQAFNKNTKYNIQHKATICYILCILPIFSIFLMPFLGHVDCWLNFNSSLHLLVRIKGMNCVHIHQTGS